MNKHEPLVSVIINCLNGAKYLKQAIDSVYSQTYSNWEIIFWDNASVDESRSIALGYDSRLRYFKNEITENLGAVRVKATQHATGEFLAFLDTDDLWTPTKLSNQLAIFETDPHIGMVYGRALILNEGSGKVVLQSPNINLPVGNIFERLAHENFIMFSSVIVRSEIFFKNGGFPQNYLNATDYKIFLKISKNQLVGCVDEPCCTIRVHSQNLSLCYRVVGANEAIQALQEFLPDQRISNAMKSQYQNLAIMHLKEGNLVNFARIIIRERVLFLVVSRLLRYVSTKFGI